MNLKTLYYGFIFLFLSVIGFGIITVRNQNKIESLTVSNNLQNDLNYAFCIKIALLEEQLEEMGYMPSIDYVCKNGHKQEIFWKLASQVKKEIQCNKCLETAKQKYGGFRIDMNGIVTAPESKKADLWTAGAKIE